MRRPHSFATWASAGRPGGADRRERTEGGLPSSRRPPSPARDPHVRGSPRTCRSRPSRPTTCARSCWSRGARRSTVPHRTSILERLNGPVCNAVVGGQGSHAILGALVHRPSSWTSTVAGSGITRCCGRCSRRSWRPANPRSCRSCTGARPGGSRRPATWTRRWATRSRHATWSWRRPSWARRWCATTAPDVAPRRSAGWRDLGTTRCGNGRGSRSWPPGRPCRSGDPASTERFAELAERGTFAGRPPDGTASFEFGRAILRACMGRGGAQAALRDATRALELEPVGSPWADMAHWMLAIARQVLGDRRARTRRSRMPSPRPRPPDTAPCTPACWGTARCSRSTATTGSWAGP